MKQQNCLNLPIKELHVTVECLESLRKAGFETVSDIVEIIEQIYQGGLGLIYYSQWLNYFDEIVNELKVIGCWPEGLEEV